ncbi:MAG: LysR family transcriptional regulator [Actinomycetaceae bacterium]|nr:LysR family transcriptional regulator [Actinomycetaceae bacterium]
MAQLPLGENITLRQLRYFIAVVDARSISRAARSLFVSQPTLTVAMKKLSHDLGTRLLTATDQGYELTQTGRILYDEGVRILDAVAELEETIAARSREENKTLKVGLTHLFTMQFMPQILEFINTHPHTEVTFVQGGSRYLQARVENGELDFALVSFPQFYPSLAMEELRTTVRSYEVCAVMRTDHPLSRQKHITWADLNGHKISSLGEDYVLYHVLQNECKREGFTPEIVFTNDSETVLQTSVKEMNSVTLLPRAFGLSAGQEGLEWVPMRGRHTSFPIAVATRRGEDLTPDMADFISCIQQN